MSHLSVRLQLIEDLKYIAKIALFNTVWLFEQIWIGWRNLLFFSGAAMWRYRIRLGTDGCNINVRYVVWYLSYGLQMENCIDLLSFLLKSFLKKLWTFIKLIICALMLLCSRGDFVRKVGFSIATVIFIPVYPRWCARLRGLWNYLTMVRSLHVSCDSCKCVSGLRPSSFVCFCIALCDSFAVRGLRDPSKLMVSSFLS